MMQISDRFIRNEHVKPIIAVTATTRVTHQRHAIRHQEGWDLLRWNQIDVRRGFRFVGRAAFPLRLTPRKPHMAWRVHQKRPWCK